MTLKKLLEQTREAYRNESDPIKRKVIASFGKSLKSNIEMMELKETAANVKKHLF